MTTPTQTPPTVEILDALDFDSTPPACEWGDDASREICDRPASHYVTGSCGCTLAMCDLHTRYEGALDYAVETGQIPADAIMCTTCGADPARVIRMEPIK